MKRPRIEVKEEVETSEKYLSIKSEELKCELCDKICSSISHLQTHTLSEHLPFRKVSPSSPQQNVCCQQCSATFDSFAQFASHMRSHLGSTSSSSSSTNPTSFSCPMCPLAMFGDLKSRLEHITTQHLQVRLMHHTCTECDTSFASPSAVSAHFSQSHIRVKLECSACSYVTEHESSMKEHSKTHTRQDMIFGCSVCGCTFAEQSLLIAHVQLTHDRDSTILSRPIGVRIAKMVANSSGKHSKTRILQCSVCDESVVGEDGLDEHRLYRHCKVRFSDRCADCHGFIETEEEFLEHCTHHSKDMTMQCPVCRQTLRSETQIHAHKNYHMAPRPLDLTPKIEDPDAFTFVCPVCGEKFEDALKLIEHSQKHDEVDVKNN